MRRIGIVGVGLLGSSVALRPLQSGFEVTGYDTCRCCLNCEVKVTSIFVWKPSPS